MLLTMSLKSFLGFADMSFSQHIWVLREMLLKWQKIWSTVLLAKCSSPNDILVFFLQGKTEKEKFIWYALQVRGMVWVEERKQRSHSESFESPWVRDRAVPVSPRYSLWSALNRSAWTSISMINTSIAQSPQWPAGFYLQKNSCRNKSSVLWSCTPSDLSVQYSRWWIAGCAGEILCAKSVRSLFCQGSDAKR